MSKLKHLIFFKIMGVIGIIVAIIGFVLIFIGFGDFQSNNFMIGGIMTAFGLFIGITCLMIGFRPAISKMAIKTAKHIQEENKQDLTDITTTRAEISSDAIKTITKSIKDGLSDNENNNTTKYCKECGAQIDADSKFCSYCGKEQ